MKWEFNDGGDQLLARASTLPQITLTSGNSGNITMITQYDCSKSHKTLENWMNPALMMTKAQETLLKTSQVYAKKLMTSNLSKHDTWRA